VGKMAILAVDIGGTFIKYSMYDQQKQKLEFIKKVATPQKSLNDLVKVLVQIREAQKDRVTGLALSLPGTLNSRTGYIFQGGSLRYNSHQNLKRILEKRLGIPVALENDARCSAMAELWQGNLVKVKNALVLVLGTGLGGAVVLNGKIYKGQHLFAGELSLIFTQDYAKYKFSAALGTQVSVTRFVKQVSQKVGHNLNGLEVFNLIKSHTNSEIEKQYQAYLHNFVQQIFNFQLMLDPEIILIGGGISQNEFYMESLHQELLKFYQSLPIKIPPIKLEACKFHNSSNLLGAVRNYLTEYEVE
jgi:predicted NBD/HSP70 family sugar kinase